MKRGLTRQEQAMLKKGWIPVGLAAEKMGVDPATVYRQIDAQELEGCRVGKRRFVKAQSCLKFLGPEAAKALGLT